jgi:thiol-disulfide isomerase/thioredoxin
VERATIGDFRGKILVLDMYATWCAPCRDSIPQLIELQRRYESKGLQVVGLNVGGPDDRVKVPQFAQELGINYPVGFPDRQLTDLLMGDDSSIPQTFVFSRDGTLVQRFIGYGDIAAGQLEQLIQDQTADNLLGGSAF